MAVSNESGEVFDWASADRPVLVDATQAVGKIPFRAADADFVTISGHKFGGPKGVGALYLRDPEGFEPLLRGGGHEHGLRSGTLNVPGIVGLGVAARLAQRDREARHAAAAALRDAFVNSLEGAHMRVNQAMNQSPYIVSVTCFGWLAEAVVVEADNRGFGISAGAACGSENPQASPGHLARGMTEAESRATVRVSFGPGNTVESAAELGRCLSQAVSR
jgi:cysteine desulfurase